MHLIYYVFTTLDIGNFINIRAKRSLQNDDESQLKDETYIYIHPFPSPLHKLSTRESQSAFVVDGSAQAYSRYCRTHVLRTARRSLAILLYAST